MVRRYNVHNLFYVGRIYPCTKYEDKSSKEAPGPMQSSVPTEKSGLIS